MNPDELSIPYPDAADRAVSERNGAQWPRHRHRARSSVRRSLFRRRQAIGRKRAAQRVSRRLGGAA